MMRYWAVIPAAGIGQRMQSTIPKQYLPLAGRFVIDNTLTPILIHPKIAQVYVVLRHTDTWWPSSQYAEHPAIIKVPGGAKRADSVLNALHVLAQHAATEDWVLVHDAARPYLRTADIDHLINQVTAHPTAAGGVLGQPVRDTMKRTRPNGEIIHTVERTQLWHAFTPQMCRFGTLYQGLQAACAANRPVTDEASVMEWLGETMIMVPGHTDNIKITYPEDCIAGGH